MTVHTNPVIAQIRTRLLRRNKNFLLIVCGETGSGKSLSAIKLAKMIDDSFTTDRIVFSVEDFLGLLNSGDLRKGNVIIFDEAGVGMPAREWYSISNKAVNYVMQTFRHLNLCVIFTTPDLSYIDSQTRKLFHAFLQMLSIDYERNHAIGKLMFLQHNPRLNKIYWKYPRVKDKDGISVVKTIRIKKPPRPTIRAYQILKKRFTNGLNLETEREVKAYKKEKERVSIRKRIDEGDAIDKVLETPDVFRNAKGRIDTYKIMAKFGVGEATAKKVRAGTEMKLKN